MISWSYALRELRRRPGRSLLSLLSVIIAVAAIVAVTSASATTRKAYQQVYEALAGRTDLEVVARGGGRFSETIADSLKDLPGVRAVVPVFHRATIIYAHSQEAKEKVKVLAYGIDADQSESWSGFHLAAGRLPTAVDEVAIEAELATSLKLGVGDEIRMLTARGLRPRKISGLVAFENASRLQQGGMLLGPLKSLQQTFRSGGEVDALHVFLDQQDRAPEVIAAAGGRLPPELRIRVPSSRSGLAEEMLVLTQVSLNMASALSFTTAVFIVLSAFLMNVGERRRQLSILRAVGATRRQVVGMVCYEALVMGIIGTLVGIPVGIYGGTFLMRSMAEMLQTRAPAAPDMFWAFVVGGVMGPVICLLAAWYPARKAGQVSPLEGMRPVVTLEPHRGHRTATIAGVTGLIITAFMAIGSALGILPMTVSVLGVVISLVSLVLLLPVALGPAVRLLAWPLGRLLAVEGEMSERMVLRHAGRSSLTIGALLMAVAAGIGTSNAVFSITDDVHNWNERSITADFLVRAMMPDMGGQDATSMDESLGKEIAGFDGVERVEAIRLLRVEAGEREAMLLARDFAVHERAPLEIVSGDAAGVLGRLAEGEVAVGSVLAQRLNLHVGSTLAVVFGERTFSFRVAAVATEYSFGGSVVYIDLGVARRLLGVQGADVFLVKAAAAKAAEIEPKVRALASDNGLIVQSFLELRRLIDSMVNGVTGGLWVLLVLGLLVGALGVVNTLTMNVLEQTRELGMLRAIGMRRHQVVKTVLGQAALIGSLGILAGAGSGLILARMINICLGSMFGHYVTFAARPHYIAALLGLAMVVVMVAALVPARRASRLNAIQAMRQD